MPQMTIQQALEMARAHHRAGQIGQAESIFRQILTASPDPLVCNDLGNLLADAQRFNEAIAAYHEAIKLQPDYAEAFHNLATVFETMGRREEAMQAYRDALALNPQLAEAHYNLGKILQDVERFDEAIDEYRRAIQIQPGFFEAHGNLGNALKALGRIDEAIDAFGESLRLSPDHPETNRNLAGALLLSGDLPRGFTAYGRWRKLAQSDAIDRSLAQPEWDGAELNGRRILLYEQQGFGDVIQLVRYAPHVAARGGRVMLACPKELARLLSGAEGIDSLITDGDPWTAIDVRCSLFDLPRIFGTTIDTIPAKTKYLNPDPSLVSFWRQRLADVNRLKVGLCWAGRSTHQEDASRSIKFEQLSSLLQTPDVQFVSLQKGPRAEHVSQFEKSHLIDWTRELNDFADTAALIENLDLIITVDTAVAHLAGALGKRVWLLLPFVPEWRWMMNRDDSPWYPTMRLLRQPRRGDWLSVISQAMQMLA